MNISFKVHQIMGNPGSRTERHSDSRLMSCQELADMSAKHYQDTVFKSDSGSGFRHFIAYIEFFCFNTYYIFYIPNNSMHLHVILVRVHNRNTQTYI